MCKLTEEQIEFAKNMFNDGNNTYYDVCRELENKYDVVINPESLRYYITRKDKPKVTLKDRLAIDGISKMLVISDLHVPYHRDDILDIVKKHAEEIEVLVLGGDVIDCYSISSFKPLEPKPLITEMANCHRLLKDIQSIIPDVRKIIIKGNHEERWAKYMSNMSSEVNKLHSDNIMREIVKGFESHDRQAGTITTYEPLDYEIVDTWYCQVNDVIVCHPITFSRVAGKTSEMALNYFVEGGFNFNVALVAHTHKASSCYKYGKYAAEIGCTCKPQEYANKGKLTYTQQINGYFLATFKDNKFDINHSRNYILQ